MNRASSKRSNDEEEDRKPPAKKRSKSGKNVLKATSSVALPLDALAFVMEFLSPRQLYNLAFTCKTLRDAVSTKVVVKAALIHGGHAKRTMDELHKLMSTHSCHVPSPLRLLRLTNGKRCEVCCKVQVNFVRPCLGVFACWDCVTVRGLTKPWKLSWARYRHNAEAYDVVLDHPRVATNRYGDKAYMWAAPRKLKNGEMIGPLATFQDIDGIYNHLKGGGTVETYMKDILAAPDVESYQEFNDAHDETVNRAKKVAEEREEKKAAAKAKAKDTKLAKVEKMVKELATLIDEPFREAALGYSKIVHCWDKRASMNPTIEFEVEFVDKLLRPYVLTPSKIRKKILKDIAETINSKFYLIDSTRFLQLPFLSDDDPFEAALKSYFGPKLQDTKSLLRMSQTSMRFFDFLEKGFFIPALSHLIDGDLTCLLKVETEYEGNLAKLIWLDNLKKEKKQIGYPDRSADYSDDEDQIVSHGSEANFHAQYYDDNTLRRAFLPTKRTYEQARHGLQEYDTWLREKLLDDSWRRWRALSSVSKSKLKVPLLIAKNFEAIFNKHEMWNNKTGEYELVESALPGG